MENRDALRVAAGVAGRGFMLKIAAGVAVLMLIFLVIVAVFGIAAGGKALANSCGKRGSPMANLGGSPGEESADAPDRENREEQIENAKIIDEVAKKKGLSGRATLIALMTALQESTLLNLDFGDADSIGIFQQRPSTGWGSKEDIMKPEYAATMFFFGDKDGSPAGLTDVNGWEYMDIRDVINKVQRPNKKHLDLYLGQESAAREIAKAAKIDLNRKGKNGNRGSDDAGQAGDIRKGLTPEECYEESGGQKGKPGKVGSPFHDGAANWPDNVKNPRSTADAIAWAKKEAETGGKKWYRKCLAFVAITYGWSYSGVQYAVDHYHEMPADMKRDKERRPPPGALMYWDTGQRAGHVAVYLGDGKIASNDIRRPGYIDIVPATEIEKKWGAKYLGWAPPYFPKGG
ncbi:peptidase M23 [Streptomyces olivaceus]|uniref:peptidase M23 n=1 Tax=Streptomyces olivaceus TaxID=47716 RepID=UPI0036FEDC33